jgi:hypothetical protein
MGNPREHLWDAKDAREGLGDPRESMAILGRVLGGVWANTWGVWASPGGI